jgi:hypothetical protein
MSENVNRADMIGVLAGPTDASLVKGFSNYPESLTPADQEDLLSLAYLLAAAVGLQLCGYGRSNGCATGL